MKNKVIAVIDDQQEHTLTFERSDGTVRTYRHRDKLPEGIVWPDRFYWRNRARVEHAYTYILIFNHKEIDARPKGRKFSYGTRNDVHTFIPRWHHWVRENRQDGWPDDN